MYLIAHSASEPLPVKVAIGVALAIAAGLAAYPILNWLRQL